MRQKQALTVMLSGASVFLTGAPGAGKTYVLNEFLRRAKKQGKKVAKTASTGIAATHIGGTTIHSWSGLGIREELAPRDEEWLRGNDRLRKRYLETDVLVVDEVSMLKGQYLDMVEMASRILRESDEPFGGMQVVLVGDLFQLPPISRGMAVDFIHMSNAWRQLSPKICYLTEQHRQEFDNLLAILEAMRRGEQDEWVYAPLQERMTATPGEDEVVTRLYTHNVDVDAINVAHLQKLDSEVCRFTMTTKGAKADQLAKSVLAPDVLELKLGAEVMFVANNFSAGFANGSRGTVVAFEDEAPVVQLHSNGKKLHVEPHSWSREEDGKVRAEVAQLPLRLAWALTIHKSQGMTLDAAEIDLSRSFTPGMGYVALSRVRRLEGVYLRGMNNMALRLHPDIFALDARLREASGELAAAVDDYREETTKPKETVGVDEDLFEALKRWRLQRAKQENMPAYIIAHNSVLEAVSTSLPETMSDLMKVPGMGAKKIEKYGQPILDVVAAYVSQKE